MTPLPTDPLELAILLHKHVQQIEIHGRRIEAQLPPTFDFASVESALDAADLLVSSDELQRKVEVEVPRTFFWSLDELVSTGERRTSPPATFYLADIDYLYDGSQTNVPAPLRHYLEATQFYALLGKAADHIGGVGSTKTLVFLQTEKLEIVPEYSVDDLAELQQVTVFKTDFILTETHKEQKATIVRTVLMDMFKRQARVRFAELLWRFSEFMEKLDSSYQLYVSEFSFQKVKAEIEKEKLDATTKLNKVFSDIQSQLLAVPAALILVGGQMENRGGWESKNVAIWLGCLVFAIMMTLLVRNQRHTLNAVKQEIDQQWQQIKGKYHSVADRFEASYTQLDRRYRHQRWLIRVISFLVAVSLAVSTVMLLRFSVPGSLMWESLMWGIAAATPLAGWDIFHCIVTRYVPEDVKKKLSRFLR
jgi:hypothetical protein